MEFKHNYEGGPKWTTPPTQTGPCGRAWRCEFESGVDKKATVDNWLIDQPGAHPLWWWYVLYIVHLRDLSGLDRPKLSFPEATHELGVVSLSPEFPVFDPACVAPGQFHYLTPHDHCIQFVAHSDVAARGIAESMVELALKGFSLDQDYRTSWAAQFQQWTSKMQCSI